MIFTNAPHLQPYHNPIKAFGWMVRQSAEVENSMNGVERILHYANHIEQEAPHEIPDAKPPASWPATGEVQMRDVVLAYRPGLPPVLKGVSVDVRGGEHVGIVGRTGAGKTTSELCFCGVRFGEMGCWD